MNALDSEKIAGDFLRHGMSAAADISEADVIAINTCSVRDKAVQKAYARLGEFRRLKAARPGMVVCVVGCMAQIEGEKILKRAPYVDIVTGPQKGHVIGNLVEKALNSCKPILELRYDGDPSPLENKHILRNTAWRASVTISEGCSRCCAFCIVPEARGPERHREMVGILEEIGELADNGCLEIMLLGQTVNSWFDPSDDSIRFPELLRRVADVPGIRRVRFASPHPNYFSDDLLEVIASHETICNHVHLPVQSGSTRILRAMNRGYTRMNYLEIARKIRSAPARITISTDIIVGYPGETEADFQDTLSIVDTVRYTGVFSFKYSPRPRTTAYDLPDDVPEKEKSRRLALLQERQREIQCEMNAAYVGQKDVVLVESNARSRMRLVGRTADNRIVNFDGSDELIGSFTQVEITGFGPNSFKGKLIKHGRN